MNISVVVPLFNEEGSLCELNSLISKVMRLHSFTYEVIYIDDGSNDSSWSIIKKLASKDKCVKGIKFRRNYDKSSLKGLRNTGAIRIQI